MALHNVVLSLSIFFNIFVLVLLQKLMHCLIGVALTTVERFAHILYAVIYGVC